MKLIEMRCPNCDAPLSVNSDRDEAFCLHCNTTFLIEDAPKAEVRNRSDVVGELATKQQKLENTPDEITVEYETAKSEPPGTKRFTGTIASVPSAKTDVYETKEETGSETLKTAAEAERAAAQSKPSERMAAKHHIAIAIAIVAVLLITITASVGTCSMQDSHSAASSDAHDYSHHAISSSGSETSKDSPSAVSAASKATKEASSSAATEQASPGSASSIPDSSPTTEDGFPCNLDATAAFSGVTIPIDSTWEDYSPAWDWRRKTFSYTADSGAMGDVQISISTFTGGDTQDAIAFMKDYADFAPIYLDYGEYTIKSNDVRDGVTYTRIEGVDSNYENSFSYNPPSKHGKIRDMHAKDVVRCVCLVGYAVDGTGFAVAVSLRGSADNDECLYTANKILDGVTFVPAECNIDSTDSWLYEVQH